MSKPYVYGSKKPKVYDLSGVQGRYIECDICYNASEELSAAWRFLFMLRGEMATDACARDIEMLESMIEEHPNHETDFDDLFIAMVPPVVSDRTDDYSAGKYVAKNPDTTEDAPALSYLDGNDA